MLCVRISRRNILPGEDVGHSLMIGSPDLGPLPNFSSVMRHATAVDAGPALVVSDGAFLDSCFLLEMRHRVQEWVPHPIQGNDDEAAEKNP